MASKNGLQIATVVKTETTADGKTKTTKTDTATTTKCTGVNQCTSSTTTVTTTTVTGSGGTTESVSSTCKGANCPDKSTNPDGDGDGLGDCATGDCQDGLGGEGEGGGFGGPEFEEVDDYQTTTQKFYDSVKASPLIVALDSISAPTTGVAPNLQTSSLAALGGASLDFGIITDLAPIIKDVLSAVMKAFWCFVALIIFLMA
ncbi:hypothetical protein D9M70_396230 [compost metagenome]